MIKVTIRDSMRQSMSVSRNIAGNLVSGNPSHRSWSRPTEISGVNALTCDVEDYFQVSAFEHLVPKDSWDSFDCRIPNNVDRVLLSNFVEPCQADVAEGSSVVIPNGNIHGLRCGHDFLPLKL